MAVLLLTSGSPDNLLLTSGDNLLLTSAESLSGGVSGVGGSSILIEFSPTTDPFETPVWVDITSSVRFLAGVTMTRGRSTEFDDFQAGRCTFTLDNRDRLFDPTYTAGTYYGNLLPLRRFRVRASFESTTYDLFAGFILGWPQEYADQSDADATVPVTLVDGFGVLALATLYDSAAAFTLDSATLGVLGEDRLGVSGADAPVDGYAGDLAQTLLDAVGYPDVACDTGLSLVTSDVPTGSVLSKIKQLEKSEDGFFYIAGDGTATFLDRTSRQTLTRISTSQATFDDDGTDAPYGSIAFDYNADQIYNDVRRTGTSGQAQTAEDATSIQSYFRRTSEETLITVDDGVTRDLATVFLDRHKDPLVRVGQITVPVGADPATLFPAAVGRELLDRVTVRRTPQDVGSVYASEQLVEGITHSFDTKQWTTTLQLSPGFITAWFTLDSSTLGVLDEDQLGG